jgi:hypothetical protein
MENGFAYTDSNLFIGTIDTDIGTINGGNPAYRFNMP